MLLSSAQPITVKENSNEQEPLAQQSEIMIQDEAGDSNGNTIQRINEGLQKQPSTSNNYDVVNLDQQAFADLVGEQQVDEVE